MADKSSDDVLRPAWSLATSGVKIIAVGIGSPCHHNQLSSITFSSSHFLCTPTLDNVTSVSGDIVVLICDLLGLNIYGKGTSNLILTGASPGTSTVARKKH